MEIILIIAGLTVVVLAIRWVISTAVHRGADAIGNAITEKKNKDNPSKQENLADRYKSDKQ